MATIPLPALHTAPIEQPPNMLQQYAQMMGIKSAQQEQAQRAAMAPLQQQEAQQSVDSGQIQLQQQQQAQKDQQTFRTAMQDPANQGKTIGDLADALANKGAISMQGWQQMKKADIDQRTSLATLDEKGLANAAAAHKQTLDLYTNAMNMPDDQLAQSWPSIAQQYDAIPGNQKMPLNPQQPMTKEQLQQFGPMLSMHQAYLDDAMARQQKQVDLSKGQAETQFYQQNGGAPGVPAEMMQQADWIKKNPGKGPSDYKLWVMQNSPMAMMANSNLLGKPGDSDALDLAANNYRQTGQMPAGFSRSPQTTSAIIARAAALDQQSGGSGIAANKAILQANTDSLKGLQRNFDQVSAFEATAEKNINLLQTTAQKIPDLGARFANVPVRMISANMIGTDNMAAFKTALNTAQTESAKVLNSSNATGVLSDSSRHELQEIIDGNVPYSALVSSLTTLKQDMSNRHASYQQQIEDIQNRIKTAGQPVGGGAGAAITVTAPNGKVYTFKDQQSAAAFRQNAGIQ
jgi:hypothetical protein